MKSGRQQNTTEIQQDTHFKIKKQNKATMIRYYLEKKIE
ncbi:hypothetical Protein YC6258_05764 [Gynuella sunshinyii YC6258]|uniref:Uncharacterized protein n=1 Tax=Gynuella sunshinyii YC6258 TaxID=1445510 RepID=A0A0C5VT07_9GAMM|nr:hypothetical Protein YC6258_05764 [Gynuella sunshinyii YC6258]